MAAAAAGRRAAQLGASALEVAQDPARRDEEGTNTGAEVDEYLAAAEVAPGNPWCASFVTWSLEQAGHKMEGGGWAAVQTWVRAAEEGNNDLQIVSSEDARPGDIVAYDWGRQDDFGSDGHIGFLASNVKGGKFTALEGNNQDQVMNVPRHLDSANVKFIRIGRGGAAPALPDAAAAPPAARRARSGRDARRRRRRGRRRGRRGAGRRRNPYPGDNAPRTDRGLAGCRDGREARAPPRSCR